MKKRWGESTDRVDQVETEEVTNPVNGGDNGDRLLRKIEDLLSEPSGLVCGVLGGHDGEERETEEMGVGRGSLGYIGCRVRRCWAGMSNRNRRRSLYVRPGNDVVIVWTRREKGFTKFLLDWPKASIRLETRGKRERERNATEEGEPWRNSHRHGQQKGLRGHECNSSGDCEHVQQIE